MATKFYDFFDKNDQSIFSAASPGRLDVMGGIADYSGSMVLQKTIAQETKITLRERSDGVFKVISKHEDGSKKHLEIPFSELLLNQQIDYVYFREKLKQNTWACYVLGCFLILMKENKLPFEDAGAVSGADILIESSVPMGKGVASSAALEVATLKCIKEAYQINFEGTELAILAQRVENEIVSAPCGLMDQLTSCFGEKNSILPIVCQPDLILNPILIPSNIRFCGIDSGKKHSVAGNPYRDVRTAAFMGMSMIEQWMGATKKDLSSPQKLHYKGYLANISKYDFDVSFLYKLPKRISGAEFIEKYGHSIDAMTTVNLEKIYAVRQATLHPVYENERVKRFVAILKKSIIPNNDLLELGELMLASHESYSACGLGSDATDYLVLLAQKYKNQGVLGAKITGGGNGGTVVILAIGAEGLKAAKQIHADYQAFVGHDVVFFD